jgi:hypothetical protein
MWDGKNNYKKGILSIYDQKSLKARSFLLLVPRKEIHLEQDSIHHCRLKTEGVTHQEV